MLHSRVANKTKQNKNTQEHHHTLSIPKNMKTPYPSLSLSSKSTLFDQLCSFIRICTFFFFFFLSPHEMKEEIETTHFEHTLRF